MKLQQGDKKAGINSVKTYKHLYESMLSPEMVAKCALDAADGKLYHTH